MSSLGAAPVLELTTRGGGRLTPSSQVEARIDGALLQVNPFSKRFRGEQRAVPFTAVAADVKHAHIVAAGDGLGRVALFDVMRNRYTVWRVGGEAVVDLCFVSHGKELCVSLADGSVVCLNVADGNLTARLMADTRGGSGAAAAKGGGTGGPWRIVANGDSGLMATFDPERVVLWNAAASWEQVQLLGAPGDSSVVAVRLLDDLVLVLFDDDRILAWCVDDFKLRYQLRVSEGPAGLTCFAAAQSLVVAGGRNAMIYFWDTASEVLLRVVEMPSSANTAVQIEFLRKSAQVALLGDDGRLLLLTSTTASCVVDVDLSAGPSAFPVTAFAVGAHDHYAIAMSAREPGTCCKLYDVLAARRNARELRQARKRLPKAFDASLHVRAPFGAAAPFGALPSTPTATGAAGSSSLPATGGGGNAAGQAKGAKKKKSPAPGAASVNGSLRSLSPPLRLAPRLGGIEKQLNMRRIQALLLNRGELPKKYRTLVWRFLLQLPENHDSFTALLGKGIHPAYQDLPARYPLRDSRVLRKLQLVLSALAYWSPICGELEYLPSTVFPFVLVFEADDLGSFETVMSVLLHWEREFLCTFPHPPIPLLGAVERALRIHDPDLAKKFASLATGPQVYAWPLLRSAFTEVLGREEWLQLWDHLFAWHDTPQLLLLAAVSYLLTHRSSLLTMTSASDVQEYVTTEHCLDMKQFLSKMHALMRHTQTVDMFSKVALFIASKDEGPAGGAPEASGGGARGALLSSAAAAASTTRWPIPEGCYPPLRGYPKFVMDFQQAQRRRIAAEQEETAHKEFLVDEVKRRTEELLQKEAEWAEHQERLQMEEDARRSRMREAYDQNLESAVELEDERRQARLEHIVEMERVAGGALDRSAALTESHAAQTAEEVRWAEKRMTTLSKLRADENQVAAQEQMAHEQLEVMAAARGEEERKRQFRASLEEKKEAVISEEARMLRVWDDEDRAAKEALRSKQGAAFQHEQELGTARDLGAMQANFNRFQRDRKDLVANAEAQRQRRLAATSEIDALMR